MATTRNLTILLTDIKGFTDKTSHKSRAAIDAMLEEHKSIVLPALEDRGGRLLKTIGDAFLMTFDSPTDAVLAGMAVQDALAKRNEGLTGEDRLEVRIAINVGEVNITDSDVFGEPVNITARIESVAEAGEVFFTEAVYLAMNKTEVPSSEVGTFKLKGIEREVKVYKVRRETPLSGTAAPAESAVRSARPIVVDGPSPKAWRAGLERPAAAAAAGPLTKEERTARRKTLMRRGLATLVDVIICSIVAGVLAGGDRTEVRFKPKKLGAAPAIPKLPASGTFTAGPDGVVIKGSDGSEAVIGEKGVRAKSADGTELRVDEGGVKVKPAGAAAEKTVDVKVGLTGVDVTEKDADADEDDGGVTVERHGKSRKEKLFPFVWIALNVLALSVWGATPGKKFLGFKVVRHEDGATPDWKVYALRSVMTLLSASPAGLGYWWSWWEKDGRGWHDLIAGTRVVRTDA